MRYLKWVHSQEWLCYRELSQDLARMYLQMPTRACRARDPAHCGPRNEDSSMKPVRSGSRLLLAGAALAVLLSPVVSFAQSSTSDKWIHVRVTNKEDKTETVKVNVPLDMAEKILPAINKDRLHNGKVTLNGHEMREMEGVDCKAILDAVRTAKDGEFVTVQSHDSDVRVAKEAGFLLVYVTDKGDMNRRKSKDAKDDAKTEKKPVEPHRVEVKVPMKVVDALFSSGKSDELDVLAALRALSTTGDIELVSVKDNENVVRVWIDSKNISD